MSFAPYRALSGYTPVPSSTDGFSQDNTAPVALTSAQSRIQADFEIGEKTIARRCLAASLAALGLLGAVMASSPSKRPLVAYAAVALLAFLVLGFSGLVAYQQCAPQPPEVRDEIETVVVELHELAEQNEVKLVERWREEAASRLPATPIPPGKSETA